MRLKVRLLITKVYEFNVSAQDASEAREKCDLVAERRLKKNLKKVEGEIDMKENKALEKWEWKIAEQD